jgi:hypothetical protein
MTPHDPNMKASERTRGGVMSSLPELVRRYRAELRQLIVRRRRLDAQIAARRQVLRDLEAAVDGPVESPSRRGRITQVEAVRRVLASEGEARTAGEIHAASLEAGAGGGERSLRNVLSRMVKTGELVVDRRTFPQRYGLPRGSGPA